MRNQRLAKLIVPETVDPEAAPLVDGCAVLVVPVHQSHSSVSLDPVAVLPAGLAVEAVHSFDSLLGFRSCSVQRASPVVLSVPPQPFGRCIEPLARLVHPSLDLLSGRYYLECTWPR